MGIIPPPVVESPKRPVWSVVMLGCGVIALLLIGTVASVVLLGYSRLDAPPAKAEEMRARADALLEAQETAMEAARAGAGAAVPEDFNYNSALRRWYGQRDEDVHRLLGLLLRNPEGLTDRYRLIFANMAAKSDDWPEALDPGRHGMDALLANAAQWLEANDAYQELAAAIRHGLAWRVLDAAEEEYRREEPYLDAVDHLGKLLAVQGIAAARAGDRAKAWEQLELLTALSRQLLREPDARAAVTAVTLQFHADPVLWALLDDGPLTPGERTQFDAIAAFRGETSPLADTLLFEAALAPGRTKTEGIFPRLAQRVLYDRFWRHQVELVAILDEPPHEAADPLRTAFRSLPLYADESTARLRRNLYLYRIHWQSRFCWELMETAAALKQWYAVHGEYPVTLDELVDAGALGAVPVDPVWADPIHYARLGDGFALYMLRVEDWYWLYDYWLDDTDPNDLDQSHGLDWEVVWRARGS